MKKVLALAVLHLGYSLVDNRPKKPSDPVGHTFEYQNPQVKHNAVQGIDASKGCFFPIGEDL
jgi:hypothetical protein